MRPRVPLIFAALLATRAALAADAPPPGGVPDLAGARVLGLSAGIGLASGSDGILVNPAAIAARRRYAVEAGTFFDRRGARTVAQLFGGSVVDSLSSSPISAGVSYLRAQSGDYTGNLVHLDVAGAIAEKLYVGATGKWLSLRNEVDATSTERVRAATIDAGLFWQVAEYVSIGGVGYNLVSISNPRVAPRGYGAGITLGTDRLAQVTADWRVDTDRLDKTTNRYAVGAEVLLGGLVPVRAGWARDETIDTSWWSAGTGFVTRGGVALDVGYRQSLDASSARTITASLKKFLFD